MVLKYLIFVGIFVTLLGTAASDDTVNPGFLEGRLTIVSPKTVDLADADASTVTTATFTEYPLLILSPDGKKEMARMTADKNGNYRVGLPPGDYVLDVRGRAPGHLRAKPQPFTVISNQTIRVDLVIDTGVR